MNARKAPVSAILLTLLLAAWAFASIALASEAGVHETDATVAYSQQASEPADPTSDTDGKYRSGSSGQQTPSDGDVETDRPRFPSDGLPGGGSQPSEDEPVQLTAEDIERMNNGNVTMLFSEEGYLTFLRGTYYEGTVSNYEEGVESLRGVASLLGLGKGSEFFAVGGRTNANGYTYYTYLQRYGDLTLEDAVLKVIVGPDGHTAGLVSSFTPNVGIAPADEESITAEQAIEVVRQQYPDIEFTFFPDHTRQTSVTVMDVARHAWAVFTDCPAELGEVEGRAYLQHLVTYDGTYLLYTAVSSPEELVLGDNMQQEWALSWFDGKMADTYTGEVTTHDGTRRQITVPVAQDEEGNWYLADLERHILVADFYSFIYELELVPMTSTENSGWPDRYLITYESYIKVFDFFDSYGIRSTDGFGAPILILTDYCDQWHNPVDNAGSLGKLAGWALFGASAVNDYGECIDVLGHEFMHGITRDTVAGDVYENESGAVNEALSDIMGNLIEMMLGETEDEDWLIAENCGEVLRSMSFPWLHKQPVTVGGDFYIAPKSRPTVNNDFGGIHTNSSLIGHLAWQLCAQGMSYEDAFLLWLETVNLLTPYSGFREVHHALIFAAEMRGLDVEWMGVIDMICEQAGF